MTRPLLLLSITFLFFLSCTAVPITGRKQMIMVSSKRIYKLAEKNYINLLDEYDLSEDREAHARINRIGKKLIKGIGKYLSNQQLKQRLDRIEWTFELLESPAQNAIGLPNGRIIIFQGLLPFCKSDDGLAVVIAHEMAHIIAKHEWERKSHRKMRNIGVLGLSTSLINSSYASRELTLTSFGAITAYGLVLPFERKHEMEADEMGLHFMAMSGFDPLEAEQFWKRMEERIEDNDRNPTFFSTHPSPKKRFVRLRELAPQILEQYIKP